jgi:hypothetical protein
MGAAVMWVGFAAPEWYAIVIRAEAVAANLQSKDGLADIIFILSPQENAGRGKHQRSGVRSSISVRIDFHEVKHHFVLGGEGLFIRDNHQILSGH